METECLIPCIVLGPERVLSDGSILSRSPALRSIATGEDFVEMPHIDRLVAANRVHNFTSY